MYQQINDKIITHEFCLSLLHINNIIYAFLVLHVFVFIIIVDLIS